MTAKEQTSAESFRWRFHPRVFISLGAELVTSDIVAIIELVKNAYDAQAGRVDITFRNDMTTGLQVIEIKDDGEGMSRDTLANAWFTVGTPFRSASPIVGSGVARRRVTGEKGLGRLSAARLGSRLRMYTRTTRGACLRVDVDWDALSAARDVQGYPTQVRTVAAPEGLAAHGTLLQISALKRDWLLDEESELTLLRDELARFVSPFREQADFHIYLHTPNAEEDRLEVRPPDILDHPAYRIRGQVDRTGLADITYTSETGGKPRHVHGFVYLPDADAKLTPREGLAVGSRRREAECGPFSFELRVWDLDKDSLMDLAERFDLPRKVSAVRSAIADGQFSGISLYRDGVILLPKMPPGDRKARRARRDWLGLDLRRVSRIGMRISSNQIVGYVEVSADANPLLKDTADRERLVDNAASAQLRRFLLTIVAILEHERDKNLTAPGHKEPPLVELFARLRTPALAAKIAELEKRKAGWDEIREAVDQHFTELESTADAIQSRLYYYSRLATIGSLAALLQHEVGSKVSVFEEFVSRIRDEAAEKLPQGVVRRLDNVSSAVRSLKRLSGTFAPLATRQYRTRRRNSDFEKILDDIRSMREKDVEHSGVAITVNGDSAGLLSVDPGELTAILDNLLTNALYWLEKVDKGERRILVEIRRRKDGSRVDIRFHDSGPGVEEGDEERIFWPGVTMKPDGLGMGLTVASELVAQNGGKMALIKPGKLGGASFGFDLPLLRAAQ